MNYEDMKKVNIKKILSKNVLDYFKKNIGSGETKYNVVFDDKGLHLTTIIHQFMNIKDIESHKKIRSNNKKKKKANDSDRTETPNNFEDLKQKKITDFNNNKHISCENSTFYKYKSTKLNDDYCKLNDGPININYEQSCSNNNEFDTKFESQKTIDFILNAEKNNKNPPVHSSNKNLQKFGLIPLSYIEDENETIIDTHFLNDFQQSSSIEKILKAQIDSLKSIDNIIDSENDDFEFFRTVTEDTVGYIKDLYESKLIEIYNAKNNINEKKIDLLQIIRKYYGKYFFSTAGTCMVLFNRLDMPFVSAWQEYLEYLVEMDLLVSCVTLKGWFRCQT